MKPKLFVRGDLDGFFGLFIDNLLQLMLIMTLTPLVCGFPEKFVVETILPGAALSILCGNLFYSWQAWSLAKKTGNHEITAIPYGINTVSLFAYIFLIMGPIHQQTGNADLAWKAGIFACFLGGVFELLGAPVGDWLRKVTPRAGLLSALAGVAITFISMGFVFQLFASPAMAIIPMMIILISYASRVKFPGGLPGGFIAVAVGIALGWGLRGIGWSAFTPHASAVDLGFHPPQFVPGDLFSLLSDPLGWQYLAVIFPMALVNIVGSLQNLESAEAAGDRFPTRSSLLANGGASIVASLFGSAFPTTIYIGHPGWKAMGARIGYSALNGIVISLLIVCGGMTLILKFVPIEATLGILLWIGLTIMAQAFQACPPRHALAVAFGLIPCLASWAQLIVETTVAKSGTTLFAVAPKFGGDFYIYGLLALSQGFLIVAMIFGAIMALLIDREFWKASLWAFVAAFCSAVGVIHSYDLTPFGIAPKFGWMVAPQFVFAYAVTGLILLVLHFAARGRTGAEG